MSAAVQFAARDVSPCADRATGGRNATAYETCSVCRRVLLWSGGRLVCAMQKCERWGRAS